MPRNRKERQGGVAILYHESLINNIKPVENIEKEDMEIQWAEIKSGKQTTFVGVYYGKQERAPAEEVQNDIDAIKSQINTLKQEGDIILLGDFNAKLEINIPAKNIYQTQSRNGEILKSLLEDTETVALNTKENVCEWTRENRKKTEEKSVIDYAIVTRKTETKVREIRVDIEGTHRLKGKEETDHNTILLETDMQIKEKPTVKRVWKKGKPQDWVNFNKDMESTIRKRKPETFDELEEMIKKKMKKHIGQITIRNNSKRESKKAKEIREEKKKASKEYDKACETNPTNYEEIKNHYIDTQKKLREQLEKDEIEKRMNIANKLIQQGGTKSNLFWQMRKKIIKNDMDANYDIKDEEGNTIEDESKAKEHIAQYYEQLYQARPGTQEYQQWTDIIQNKVKETEEMLKTKEPIPEITMKELNTAIRSLKKGKSSGPDFIPNEIFINASKPLREEILYHLNEISKTYKIPKQWQEGEIKRLYKGKGNKGKCSAERGITLASNFGKLYERILNNRALKQIRITDAQAGGRKGRATVDHLLIIKEIIQLARVTRKPLYIAFLDVTKAYDKAWLDAIMFVMQKEGIETNLWTLIRKLNQNLTARIRTKDGLTRPIEIKDSIRQGGVLSVVQYALLMDEISKEIEKENKGIELPNTDSENKIGDLLWVDDVALMSFDEKELQDLLDITNETAKRYRIEFGKEKSKVLKIGKKGAENPTFKLGDMELDLTEIYEYLGETINNKGNIENHIKKIKGKAEVAYQTIRIIAGSKDLNYLDMETTWKLIEACVFPIITYAAETWNNTKEQTNALNRILDNVIKRTLKTPFSTPRETLYMETGIIDIEHQAKKKQVMMKHRIKDTSSKLMDTTINAEVKGGWKARLENLEKDINLTEEDYNKTKHSLKTQVNQKINRTFKEKLEKDAKNKSKVQHLLNGQPKWEPGKMKEYLYKTSREVASTIFQARSRMLKVKSNYKNKYKNHLQCRACGLSEETQNHVMQECPKLHPTNANKTTQEMIFCEDSTQLNQIAHLIQKTMNLLATYDEPRRAPTQHGGPARLPAQCRGVAQPSGTTAP